jgi:predicted RNA-binding protein with PIN domain
MALVRILVDGFSLLHNWPELAPGKPRHSAAARDELIQVLTRYQDASGTPVTVIFDGAGLGRERPKAAEECAIEVLYSRAGQTADQMIERATHRLSAYGEVLVVTDDFAERDTVLSVGGMVSSCLGFIQTIENALSDLSRVIKHHNRREQTKYKNGR